MIEIWDGNSGAGMYNATRAMNRAIELAKSNGIGCLAMKNTNHWMRGGTYGWQAADAGLYRNLLYKYHGQYATLGRQRTPFGK
jgi:LDH2 family malate/lactate/ureidoglycolate dehydrogenase